MKRFRFLALVPPSLAVAVLLVGAPSASVAGEHDQHVEHAFSLDEAIVLVRKRSGGKVLRADTTHHDNEVLHEIRILTENGRVQTWIVDGNTGKVR
ncbi:MAG: PepSY domain-containing protein [Gammaproteobacteria bacterium]